MDTREHDVRTDSDERVERARLAVAAGGQVLRSLQAVREARRAGVAPGLAPADLVVDLVARERRLTVVPRPLSP